MNFTMCVQLGSFDYYEKNEKSDSFIYPLLYENEKSEEKEGDKKINDITSGFLSLFDSLCPRLLVFLKHDWQLPY